MDAQITMQESLRSLILEFIKLTNVDSSIARKSVIAKANQYIYCLLNMWGNAIQPRFGNILPIKKNKSALCNVVEACLLGVQRRIRWIISDQHYLF